MQKTLHNSSTEWLSLVLRIPRLLSDLEVILQAT